MKIRCKWQLVNRLVAHTYHKTYDFLPTTYHVNGDKTDNRAENVRWGTRQARSIRVIREIAVKKILYDIMESVAS